MPIILPGVGAEQATPGVGTRACHQGVPDEARGEAIAASVPPDHRIVGLTQLSLFEAENESAAAKTH